MFDQCHRYILIKYFKNFPNEICKKTFVRKNSFKNKASVHMRTPKFLEVYSKIKEFAKPWWLNTFLQVPLQPVQPIDLDSQYQLLFNFSCAILIKYFISILNGKKKKKMILQQFCWNSERMSFGTECLRMDQVKFVEDIL